MSSQDNEKLLELYTNGISNEALENAEKFLENSLPLGKGVAKERLVEKVLYEEQQIEYNRKLAESLHKEQEEFEHKILLDVDKLRTLEELRQERDELKKKRAAEDVLTQKSYPTIENIEKIMAHNEDLRQKLIVFLKDVEDKAVNHTC